MILIGITGIIGSGKTTVSRMLQNKGHEIIDLDGITKEVMRLNKTKKAISDAFGEDCISGEEVITERLREKAFKSSNELKRLEELLHPIILSEMFDRSAALEKRGIKAVVIDGPLIYEKGLDKKLDKVVVVSADEDKIRERIRKRGMEKSDFERRTALQIPLKEKEMMADHVVLNNGTEKDLEKEIETLLQKINQWEEELNAP